MAKWSYDDDGNLQAPGLPESVPTPSPKQFDQEDTATVLREIFTSDPKYYQLYTASQSPYGKPDQIKEPLSYLTRHLEMRKTLERDIDHLLATDPSISPELKQAVTERDPTLAEGVLKGAFRVLNADIAFEAGVILGAKSYLQGGTFTEGFNRAWDKNYGFAQVLKEFGIASGREWNLFGLTWSDRGAVGLALDILASPVTYISFGTATPYKMALKKGAKSVFRQGITEKGAKSVVRFANQTLLTDKEFMRGLRVLRQSEPGKAVIDMMDAFAGTQIGAFTKKMGAELGEKFIPGFGHNKTVYEYLRRLGRTLDAGSAQHVENIMKVFKGWNKRELTHFFDGMFESSERLAKTRQGGKLAMPIKFADPKMNAAKRQMVGLMQELGEDMGMDKVVFNSDYIPSFFEGMSKSLGFKGKGFITKGLIKDPVYAYSTRAVQMYRVAKTNAALKTLIRKFGKSEDAVREAAEAGYREFFPSQVYRQLEVSTREAGRFLGKEGRLFLPDNVMKSLDDFAEKHLKYKLGAFMRVLDYTTHTFKAWVTSVWPAFHFRNAFSNQILRFLNEGWKVFKLGDNLDSFLMLANSKKLSTRTIRVGTKNMPLSTIKSWAKHDGITDTSQFLADIGGEFADELPAAEITRRALRWLRGSNSAVKSGRRVGAFVENHAKLASYTRALKDGYSRREATQIAFNGLFDYGNLTAFEKNVMRRFIPFYTFGRKNLELEVKALILNPGRQAAVFKTIKSIADDAIKDFTTEELEAFNEYRIRFTKETFAVPAGFNAEGKVMWMMGFGLPQTDMLEMFSKQGMYFRLNPALKIGLEQLTDVDIGRTLNSTRSIALKETYEAKELSFLFNDVWQGTPTTKQIQDWILDPNGFNSHPLTKLLGLKVGKRPEYQEGRRTGKYLPYVRANPRILNLVRNTMVARFLTTSKQFGDPHIEDRLKLVRFLTGIAIFNQDIRSSASLRTAQIKDAVGNEARMSGTGYVYKKPIASKETAMPALRKVLEDLERLRKLR